MFFVILAIVVAAFVWLGVVVALFTQALEFDSWPFGLASIAVLALGIALVVYLSARAEDSERKACESSGGEYVKVGEHAVYTGKGVIIIDDYECGKRVPG